MRSAPRPTAAYYAAIRLTRTAVIFCGTRIAYMISESGVRLANNPRDRPGDARTCPITRTRSRCAHASTPCRNGPEALAELNRTGWPLAWGLAWLHTVRDQALSVQIMTEVRASSFLRVNGPLSNVPESNVALESGAQLQSSPSRTIDERCDRKVRIAWCGRPTCTTPLHNRRTSLRSVREE